MNFMKSLKLLKRIYLFLTWSVIKTNQCKCIISLKLMTEIIAIVKYNRKHLLIFIWEQHISTSLSFQKKKKDHARRKQTEIFIIMLQIYIKCSLLDILFSKKKNEIFECKQNYSIKMWQISLEFNLILTFSNFLKKNRFYIHSNSIVAILYMKRLGLLNNAPIYAAFGMLRSYILIKN